MEKITALAVALLISILLWARIGDATPITGVGAAAFLVDSFELWDTEGGGYTFGRYESGIPDCEIDPDLGYYIDCGSNGWMLVDSRLPLLNGTGIVAFSYWEGPAFDGDGNPIPGTEDDKVKVTATIGIASTGLAFPEHSFHILHMLVEGSSLFWENGQPIHSLSWSFTEEDDQQIAEGSLQFTPDGVEGFYGFFSGVSSPSTMLIDDLFQIHYKQTYGFKELRPIINIPVPEPGFAMTLLVGAVALVVAGRRRRDLRGE